MTGAAKIPHIMAGAEPFFYPGGGVGVLCLHGLTASPAEVRWLGEYLAGQGCAVYGARLAGHGTDYRDLRRTRWQDWYASALDGYHLLRGQCDQVVVAGLSMGGVLALLMGAALPVDGLVVMAAPVSTLLAKPMRRARWLRYIRPFLHWPDRSDFPQRLKAEQARRGEAAIGRVRYDDWATHGIAELYALMAAAEARLAQITAPVLLIYSEQDLTVPLGHRDFIAGALGSSVVETRTLAHSGHILPQDSERDEVFRLADDFIRRRVRETALPIQR